MRKSGLLLSAFLLACSFVQAQEQYVEVNSKDTLMVEPTEWYYYMEVKETYDDMETTVDTAYTTPVKTKTVTKTKTPPPPPKPKVLTREEKVAQLKTMVMAHGGTLIPYTSLKDYISDLDKYMLNTISRMSMKSEYGLHIRFNSRDSLQQFLMAIQGRDDIEGGVLKINHPQLSSYYDALDVKLMEAARKKAAHLAQLAGRKLGPVTQLSEAPDATRNVLEDLFERFVLLMGSKSYSSETNGSFLTDKIKIEKSLRLRFVLQ